MKNKKLARRMARLRFLVAFLILTLGWYAGGGGVAVAAVGETAVWDEAVVSVLATLPSAPWVCLLLDLNFGRATMVRGFPICAVSPICGVLADGEEIPDLCRISRWWGDSQLCCIPKLYRIGRK